MKISVLLRSLLCIFMLFIMCGCEDESLKPTIQLEEMRSICELATQKCYYHNVAKKHKENASGTLFWSKDLNIWIEYKGTVECVIDVSKVDIQEKGNNEFYIKIPSPRITNPNIDSSSLNEKSYFVDDNSADPGMFDEIEAIKIAQDEMVKEANEDIEMLTAAQNRVKVLLERYIKNIGEATGVTYKVDFELAPIEIPQDDKKD